MNVRFDEPGLARALHDPVIERPAEKFRENCNDVKPHGGYRTAAERRGLSVQLTETFGENDLDLACRGVDAYANLFREWN